MADMRNRAGGGSEVRGTEQVDRTAAFEGSPLGYASGFAPVIPGREEARRAQEGARRAHALVEQSVSGWGGSAEELHRAALEEAARQIAAEPLSQGVAEIRGHPGKMFTRSDILAIIKGEKARASRLTSLEQRMVTEHTCDALIAIFENLE